MNKKGLLTSFSVTLGFLMILLIPLFIDLEFFKIIAMLIHWPLFTAGFFGEMEGGVNLFIIFWYGIILGLGTYITHLIIRITKNEE